MNFQDLKMQMCDMKMEMCQMKIQNGETHHFIAELKQEADKKKNGVWAGTLGVFFGLVVGVLSYSLFMVY